MSAHLHHVVPDIHRLRGEHELLRHFALLRLLRLLLFLVVVFRRGLLLVLLLLLQ
jgi:hypothetical protein